MERWDPRVCPRCKGTTDIIEDNLTIGFPKKTIRPCDNMDCEMGVIYSGDATHEPEFLRNHEQEMEDAIQAMDEYTFVHGRG